VVGLAASTIIALVSLRYSLFHGIPRGDEDLATGGSGILHTIWLYRNHPELDRFLDQAEHPTDENLRKAGMVSINFGGQLHQTSGGYFDWMERPESDFDGLERWLPSDSTAIPTAEVSESIGERTDSATTLPWMSRRSQGTCAMRFTPSVQRR
jgi:hypothetical protein